MPVRRGASTPDAAADLDVYAEGVRLMRERSEQDQSDPIGWWYQSLIHGNPGATGWQPGEPDDWSQCRHGSWFFLPWHRIYLMQFERIIQSLTGEADWGLPYWDYTDPNEIQVPPQFLDESSPLFDPDRTLRPRTVAAPTWQRQGTFAAFGGRPQTAPGDYHRGRFPGDVELNPHNVVHGFVGGDMAGFQSPLDPLFWIHHCNIDRLWEEWLTLPGRANPEDDEWLNTTFSFPDPEEGRRTVRVGDVGTTAAAGYSYDVLPPPDELRPAAMLADVVENPRKDDDLDLVGASPGKGSVRSGAHIDVEHPAAEQRLLSDAGPEEQQARGLFLRLENAGVEGGDASSMWNVYVRIAGGEPYLVGTIAPFGLAGLTESGGRQTITFDLSEIADTVAAEDTSAVDVTFEPAGPDVEGEPFWERAALYTTAG
ncbi:MAG TPA: tyrosinase family protein [Actinomycetota bacterium]|nr:tyrosinase family protein [Actinomycetota bacterium]